MVEDSVALMVHEEAEAHEEVREAPLDRVATWQDAFRAVVHVDQSLVDREVPKTGDEVVVARVGLRALDPDLNGGAEVPGPSYPAAGVH